MRYVLAMHCNVFVLAIILIFAPKVKEFQHEFLIFITEVSSALQNYKYATYTIQIIKHSLLKDPVADKAVEDIK